MTYRIPDDTSRSEIVISKSRFIATAGFADSPESAKAFIDSIKSEMTDANHHVYAFRIGHGNSITEGMSDDGEPSGTSGPPILSILRGTDLGDIIIVVTRYFGGTKLGTGGLVRAYSEAARTVLDELATDVKIPKTNALVSVSYSNLESVKRCLADASAEIIDEVFTGDVTITFKIPTEDLPRLKVEIRDITAGQTEITAC